MPAGGIWVVIFSTKETRVMSAGGRDMDLDLAFQVSIHLTQCFLPRHNQSDAAEGMSINVEHPLAPRSVRKGSLYRSPIPEEILSNLLIWASRTDQKGKRDKTLKPFGFRGDCWHSLYAPPSLLPRLFSLFQSKT